MCLRTSDKMKISHKLAIRREVGAIPPPPPHPTEISATALGQLILSLGLLILSLGQLIYLWAS